MLIPIDIFMLLSLDCKTILYKIYIFLLKVEIKNPANGYIEVINCYELFDPSLVCTVPHY